MTRFLIGAGGWAYFRVPNLHPLIAYSKAFDFVEVNSTFYRIPSLKTVESWRRMVPPNFEFSVRCNKTLTHTLKFQPVDKAFEILKTMTSICKILDADVLHFKTPPTFIPTKTNSELIHSLFSSTDLKGIRVAFEIGASGNAISHRFLQTMKDHNMIHCIDLSTKELPSYQSDTLYSRLFGRGFHNIYQPSDEELSQINKKALKNNYRKVVLGFHFARMYKDAARLKIFKETGKFPMVTKSTGIDSLGEILKEDARFPSNKTELLQHQGWKLIDLTRRKRVHASFLIEKLPEKKYNGITEIVQSLKSLEDCIPFE